MALQFNRSMFTVLQMTMKADRRLYLTRDKSRVVEEGDTAAAFLFATPGSDISAPDAEKYGLEVSEGRVVVRPPAAKSMAVTEDKALEPAEDKSAVKRRPGRPRKRVEE